MITNNKENNKDRQQQHTTNEYPVRPSPPLEVLGEVSSIRHSPPFGGVGGGFNVVILVAGDSPTHVLPLHILHTAENPIVCDGTLENLLKYDIESTAVVDDGDSLSEEFKQHYARVYHPISEQEFNDLTKAILFARSHLKMDVFTHTRPRFCYLGATGKREDHTSGNISLMLYYYRQLAIDPVMVTDCGYFVATSDTMRFESFPGQQVSISNTTCKELGGNELRWDIYPLSELWQGTSNETLSNEFTVQADGDYLIYRTHRI